MASGALRVIIRKEASSIKWNSIDKWLTIFLCTIFFCSFFHEYEAGSGPIAMSGAVYDIGLCYFLLRAWSSGSEEIQRMLTATVIILIPIAFLMVLEHLTKKNIFAYFGAVHDDVLIRDGKFRAQGPFRHPILAGTVGAALIPSAIGLLRKHRTTGILGCIVGLTMVLASNSSGPIVATAASVFALFSWYFRRFIKPTVIVFLLVFLALFIFRERSPFFIIARFDLTGSSTGFHRALLMDQAVRHLDEWWLYGTDRTVHWMPGQGRISDKHTDITNYYIGFGILGGIWSIISIFMILRRSYQRVGTAIKNSNSTQAFFIWSLGGALFSHTISSFSISYFDQSTVFFWFSIAAIASLPVLKNAASQQKT